MHPLIAALAALPLTACCIAPNTVRVAGEHQSHLTQHFGPDRTNYGAEMIGVTAQWRTKSGWFAELGEHYNLSSTETTYRSWSDGRQNFWSESGGCTGGICGPREITTLSAGYIWEIRK